MNFVSEKELIKKREENPDDPGSSEPPDNRPLFVRLKAERDKKQLEWEEEHALKNQFAITRGIDDGDADFLSQVDRIKEEQETRKRQEELELLELAKQQSVIPAHEPAQERLDRPQRSVPKQTTSKQASLLSSLVRKRPHSSSTGSEGEFKADSVARSDSLPDKIDEEEEDQNQENAEQEGGERVKWPSHCKRIGILPGLADYSDSSDEAGSSSNSECLESELPLVAVYAGKGQKKTGE